MPKLSNRLPKYRKHRAAGSHRELERPRLLSRSARNQGQHQGGIRYLCREYLSSGGAAAYSQTEQLTVSVLAAFWKHAERHWRPVRKPPNTPPSSNGCNACRPAAMVSEFGPLRRRRYEGLGSLGRITREYVQPLGESNPAFVEVGHGKRSCRNPASSKRLNVAGLQFGGSEAKDGAPSAPVAVPHTLTLFCSPRLGR